MVEDEPRRKLLVLRPDLYTGYLLTVAIIITIVEFCIVAVVPSLGQVVLAFGWFVLVMVALRRLWSVKVAHNLIGTMQLYRVAVGLVAIFIISYLMYFSFISAPQAMMLPLSTVARFLVIQNMCAAIDSVIIAALAICISEYSRELTDKFR